MTLLFALLTACSGGTDTDGGDDTSGGGGTTSSLDAPPVVINEFLAINDTINADAAGEYDDWIELYNGGDSIIQFDGLYLSDDPENPKKWALPTGQGIDAGGYALFWCDGAIDQGDHHTSFKLNKKGETLLLTYTEGDESVQADAVKYETQQADTSAARHPDGSQSDGAWAYGTPTPDGTNG